MSVEVVEEILRELRRDVGLAAMLGADPRGLEKYDLENEERAALINRDTDTLREMGVDPELVDNAKLIGRMTG